jgi:N-acyl-D-amino-acid deacylase
VFDPDAFAPRATYEEPALLAAGMRAVVVNGTLAVDNGALTGAAAGQALRHVPPPGACAR